MPALRALLVDDEELALQRLERLLGGHTDRVEIVGRARDGDQALERCAALSPDLLFLDIQMPGRDGFEVLEALEDPPWVVFCTAYDAYALKAFEACALDYLLKPVDPDRLARTLDRIERLRGAETGSGDVAAQLRRLAESLQQPGPRRLQARSGDRIRFVELDEVRYFRAADKYVEAHTYDETVLLDQSLNRLEGTLPAGRFARIHRSFLVNLDHLEEVERGLGGYSARVADAEHSRLPVSRSGKASLGL